MSEETIEQKLKNYQVLTNWQKDKIALLEQKIKEYDSIKGAECAECERGVMQDYIDLTMKLQCFESDDYLKGFNYEEIAQLAKKSLRLTTDNCKLEDKIEKVREILKRIPGYSPECLAALKIIGKGDLEE